ncbi:MAG TPA: VOC family protein [Candidatus Paceibacterota bacterium]
MKNKLLKVDNIMYRVKDLAEGERFYTEVLGVNLVHPWGGQWGFDVHGLTEVQSRNILQV